MSQSQSLITVRMIISASDGLKKIVSRSPKEDAVVLVTVVSVLVESQTITCSALIRFPSSQTLLRSTLNQITTILETQVV